MLVFVAQVRKNLIKPTAALRGGKRKDSEMEIKWVKGVGTDAQNNVYRSPENGETVTVETPDGRTGCGWTPEEALANAKGDKR
jgi:hypothetical protein